MQRDLACRRARHQCTHPRVAALTRPAPMTDVILFGGSSRGAGAAPHLVNRRRQRVQIGQRDASARHLGNTVADERAARDGLQHVVRKAAEEGRAAKHRGAPGAGFRSCQQQSEAPGEYRGTQDGPSPARIAGHRFRQLKARFWRAPGTSAGSSRGTSLWIDRMKWRLGRNATEVRGD